MRILDGMFVFLLVRITIRNVCVVLVPRREPFVTHVTNRDAHEHVAVIWLIRKVVILFAVPQYAIRPFMDSALINHECAVPVIRLGGVIRVIILFVHFGSFARCGRGLCIQRFDLI